MENCANLIDEVEITLDNGAAVSDIIADPAYMIFGCYDGAESDAVKEYAINHLVEIGHALDFYTTYAIDPDEFGIKSMTIAELLLMVLQLIAMDFETE